MPAHPSETSIKLGLKVATLAGATAALFSQDLIILFNNALQNETTSYILVVPLLFAYLIYRKRKMLRAVIPTENKDQPKTMRRLPTIAGILLTITAVLLYWYGSYTFTPLEYHMLTLPMFAAGLTLVLFNPQTLRQLAFPIAFLIFLTPPSSEILYTLGANLSTISSEASNTLANAVGVSSTINSEYGNPAIIVTRPNGTPINFTVDIACSGIYSLIAFMLFVVFVAYIVRDKPWKRIALILVGIPVIYLLNVIRITTILLIGYHIGENLALQVFHLLGGWVLVFLGTLLLLFTSEKILKTQILATNQKKCLKCNPNLQSNQNFCSECGRVLKPATVEIHKTDIIKIITTITCVILLLSIQAPVFALTQRPAIVTTDTPTGQQATTEIFPEIPDYNLQFAYRDTEFEQTAHQDMALAYLYTPKNGSNQPIWVSLEIAPTRVPLHRWETCLINWPLRQGFSSYAVQIELRDIQLAENPPIISRYFAFQYTKTNQTRAVLYWYEAATFTVNSTSKQEQVEISLIADADNPSELPQIENQLLALAKPIVDYWQPIKIWSQIAIAISQNGAYLAAATSILLAAVTILYILETEKQRKTSRIAQQKLYKPDNQLIDAIQETEKTATPTLKNISDAYQKTTSQALTNDQLLLKLAELEKIGVIKSQVTSKHDEPIQTWKTQINRPFLRAKKQPPRLKPEPSKK
jgi:exosortase